MFFDSSTDSLREEISHDEFVFSPVLLAPPCEGHKSVAAQFEASSMSIAVVGHDLSPSNIVFEESGIRGMCFGGGVPSGHHFKQSLSEVNHI